MYFAQEGMVANHWGPAGPGPPSSPPAGAQAPMSSSSFERGLHLVTCFLQSMAEVTECHF